MTTKAISLAQLLGHTPGPWKAVDQFIVAGDPEGEHPDIYIAEIAESDSEGRIAPAAQHDANARLIAAAPLLLAAAMHAMQELTEWSPAVQALQQAIGAAIRPDVGQLTGSG